MGGIAGAHAIGENIETWQQMISAMLSKIAHRGGIRTYNKCGERTFLGVLCHEEKEELINIAVDESKKKCIIFDGKIFFKNDCKSYLSGEIRSDAKCLLDIYLKVGTDFLKHIDGSYAIVIWDGAEKKLFLIRDRFGTKPLFYFIKKEKILFGSEIKSILEAIPYKPSLNLSSLNEFLSYGYVPTPDTMFDEIHQIRPGHFLAWEQGKVIEKSYWRFKYQHANSEKPDSYYIEKFLSLLESAVKIRLEKCPDAGAFLSGGLDTSSVVSMMHKIKGNSFKVFTAGFAEEEYNEINEAKILSDFLKIEHFTTLIDFDKKFSNLIEKLVWHHDAPFADTSAIPSYYASELARKYVDTVFTGDFPDQLIGGSNHQVFTLNREAHDPIWKRKLRNRKINQFVTSLSLSAGGLNLLDKIKRFLYRETFSLEDQRIISSMPIPPLLKRCLYHSDLFEVNRKNDPLENARFLYKSVTDHNLLDKLLYFDIYSYAADDLMIKVDRMSKAHGLEALSPFHDFELAEFMETVPAHLKIRGGKTKYILREALKPMLPEKTLKKKKQGFGMPIEKWLRKDLSDYVQDILFDHRTMNRGYFNKKFMNKLVTNFLENKTDYASGSEAAIICLITLEIWHRLYID